MEVIFCFSFDDAIVLSTVTFQILPFFFEEYLSPNPSTRLSVATLISKITTKLHAEECVFVVVFLFNFYFYGSVVT